MGTKTGKNMVRCDYSCLTAICSFLVATAKHFGMKHGQFCSFSSLFEKNIVADCCGLTKIK